jgi:cytosine/adenosine deaminase-related metal-dependent hydrolase
VFPAHQALAMGITNGATALGLAGEIGALEPGKKADFVLHDTARPEWQPMANVVNQLVWSADGRGVHSVWVDGVRVIDNYRATLIDEDWLYEQVRAASGAVIRRSGVPAVHAWPVS